METYVVQATVTRHFNERNSHMTIQIPTFSVRASSPDEAITIAYNTCCPFKGDEMFASVVDDKCRVYMKKKIVDSL
jgi:hypothetical protein